MNKNYQQSGVASTSFIKEPHNKTRYVEKEFSHKSNFSFKGDSTKFIKNFNNNTNKLMLPPSVVSCSQKHLDARNFLSLKCSTKFSNNYLHKRKVKRTSNNSLVIDVDKFSEYSSSGVLPNSTSVTSSKSISTPFKNGLLSYNIL